MLTRYWDDARAGWATCESTFAGKALPWQTIDSRFWGQREAVLGTGSLGHGEYPTPAEMRRSKDVPKAVVVKSAKRRWVLQRCVCGRVRPEAFVYCGACRAKGRGIGSRNGKAI